MAGNTIDLGELTLRTKRIEEALRSLPGMSEAEAKKMAQGIARQMSKAEKESEKAAKAAAQAWERSADRIKSGGEKIASLVGGPIGDLGDIVFDLGERVGDVGTVLGVAGGAAAAAAVSFTALAVGSKAIVDSALDARDRLLEQGYAAEIPERSLRSLADYQQVSDDLNFEIDNLVVSLGGELAPALTTVTQNLADGVHQWRLWQGAATDNETLLGNLVPVLDTARRGVLAFTSVGLSEIGTLREQFQWLRDDAEEYLVLQGLIDKGPSGGQTEGERVKELIDLEADRLQMIKDEAAARKSYEERQEKEAKEDEARGKEAIARQNQQNAKWKEHVGQVEAAQDACADARRELVKLADDLDPVIEKETLAGKEGERAALLVLDGYLRQQRELAQIPTMVDAVVVEFKEWQGVLEELGSTGAARMALFGESVGKVLGDEGFGAMRQAGDDLLAFLDEANARALEANAEQAQAQRDRFNEAERLQLDWITREQEAGRLSVEQANAQRRATRELFDDRRRRGLDEERRERARLVRGFNRMKALEAGQAIAAAAASALELIPAFVPIAGPGAPIAAGLAVAPALATSLAKIRSQEPPEFPTGGWVAGSPDHTELVAVRPDEPILNPRAARELGTDNVDRLNRGQPAGPTTVQIVINNRVVQTEVIAELGRRTHLTPPGQFAAGKRRIYGA